MSKLPKNVQARLDTMKRQQQQWMTDRKQTLSGSGETPTRQPTSSSKKEQSGQDSASNRHRQPQQPQQQKQQQQQQQVHSQHRYQQQQQQDDEVIRAAHKLKENLKVQSDRAMEEERQSRKRDALEIRIMVLEEELESLSNSVAMAKRELSLSNQTYATLDADAKRNEEKLSQYMLEHRKRNHAIACQRATVDEKCRQLQLHQQKLQSTIAITQSTIESLQRDLRT